MKLLVALFCGYVFVGAAVQFRAVDGGNGRRTITQVVDLLQGMLDKSKEEAEDERKLYAKYKCYCDDNEKEKKKSIEDLTTQIGLLGSEVEDLKAENSKLSQEVAQLDTDMAKNVQARNTSTALREKENAAFLTEEADLTAATAQLEQAIQVLADLGADQSLQASADHVKFMAGYNPKAPSQANLLKLQATVKQALLAANSFVSPTQRLKLEAFLQVEAPFTGTYVAQSGEVIGILRSMKDTFDSNLESARAAEKAAVEAHTNYITTMTAEYDTMDQSLGRKQQQMSGNDAALATKKSQLSGAIQQKEDDTDFLASLLTMCSDKAEEFEKRQMFRANEEAALSQAIAILNSDHAFDVFGKVNATSTGSTGPSFLQVSAAQRESRSVSQQRSLARNLLRNAALAQGSSRLASIAGLLALGNPFTKVLTAIADMKELIDKEAAQDQEQKTWCTNERQNANNNLDTKTQEISTLNGDISQLETDINDPADGLKATIANKELVLEQNSKAQTDETAIRRTENKEYQETIANCVDAAAILEHAITLLEKYYKKLEEETKAALALAQEDPAPPATWEGGYKGQSAKSVDVIDMLKFILSETKAEEDTAHTNELSAQQAYETSMADLKTEEADTQDALVTARKDLADKEVELEQKRVDLDKTEQEKIAIERFLERIKPGCDWITANFATREANRATEKAALDKAVTLLKATPAFAAAEAKALEDSWGDCKAQCKANVDHVDCKSCLAKTSVPGYCAGHPGTLGC